MVHISRQSQALSCAKTLILLRSRARTFIILGFLVVVLTSICFYCLQLIQATSTSIAGSQVPVAVYYLENHRSITVGDHDDSRKCIDKIRGKTSKSRIAVAILAANRPQYFRKILASLQHQTADVDTFDIFIFVDFIHNDVNNQLVLKMADSFNPAGGVHVPDENYGIARLTMWAVETMFSTSSSSSPIDYSYDRILILEDDHFIGHNYIEAMGMLLSAADGMNDVAVVNGNFIDTPKNGTRIQILGKKSMLMIRNDENCAFQVAPLKSMTHLNSHNVWAWATTRQKWNVIHETLKDAMRRSGLDKDGYKQRNRKLIAQVMDDICPGTGYSNWQGQDWLRACIFHSKGMAFKLQPTQRLMLYIGQVGLHMTKEGFERAGFDPLESADSLTANLERYPEDLCAKTCVLETIPCESSTNVGTFQANCSKPRYSR